MAVEVGGMRIKSVFQIIFLVNAVLTCAVYFASESNPWVDLESLVYVFFLTVILVCALTSANRSGFPLLLLLAIYTFQRYCLSPLYLLMLQQDNTSVFFDVLSQHSSSDYNVVLRYAVLGFIATASGLLLGTKLKVGLGNSGMAPVPSLLSDRLNKRLNTKVIASYVVLLFALILYEQFVLGGEDLLVNQGVSNWYGIFRRGTTPLHLTISVMLFNWEVLKKRDLFFLVMPLILIAGVSVLSGARSFFYVLLLLTVVCCALKYGNYRVKRSWFRIAFIFGIVSIIAYPLATAFR